MYVTVTAAGVQIGAAADCTGWTRRWDDMIAYAARRGWLSPDGTTVRAHVVDLWD